MGLPGHIIHFSRQGLGALLRRAGFEVNHHTYISRIPYFSISNRLHIHGRSRQWVNYLVRVAQRPPLFIADMLGLGALSKCLGGAGPQPAPRQALRSLSGEVSPPPVQGGETTRPSSPGLCRQATGSAAALMAPAFALSSNRIFLGNPVQDLRPGPIGDCKAMTTFV